MKGERRSESSSEYEESADERQKRRGVRGGLGKGKVMKDEEGKICEGKLMFQLFKYFLSR